jgi:hypothetical protein
MKKKLKGYETLQEAVSAARKIAVTKSASNSVIPVYKESDGSYTVKTTYDGRAKLEVGVDNAGNRYRLMTETLDDGRRVEWYEKIDVMKGNV